MATYTVLSSQHLTRAICCHAATGDGSLIALCPNGSDVILLERAGGTWSVAARLEGHDQVVSGLDFFQDPASGLLRLVSSSHDRNSYVWTRQPGGGWSPELVITKLSRAGLCVRWAPAGTKFAIGSGEKSVCVCYYDADKELWAPKLIKKQHDSSVAALAWHPGGAVLATGSTDGRCRVFNAAIADVDGPSSSTALAGSRFGEALLDVEAGSWVLAAAWSPGGSTLAFCCQDATLTLLPGIDLAQPGSLAAARRQRVQLLGLPLKCLAFLSESVLAGGGFDFRPLLVAQQGAGEWQLVSLQRGSQQGAQPGPAARSSSLASRIQMFEAQVAKPQAGSSSRAAVAASGGSSAGEQEDGGGTPSEQAHSNCIMSITPLGGGGSSKGGGMQFLTSGLDGRVVEWRLDGLSSR